MFRFFFVIFYITLLISCGGGGNSQLSISPLDFSQALMAEPTLQNGEKVEETAAVNQQNQYSLNSISANTGINPIFVFHKLANSINQSTQTDPYSLNAVVSEFCEYGGDYSGTVSGDLSNGNAFITYDDCSLITGITMSGTVMATLTNCDIFGDCEKVNITYVSNVLIEIDDSSLGAFSSTIIAGSTQEAEYSNRNLLGYTLDMKITAIQIVDGRRIGLEDADVRSKFNLFTPLEMYYRSGRFFIDDLMAYADYDTSYDMSLTPFIFDNNTGEIISGEARFRMANGGIAKIVGNGGEPMTYVDADGDGFFELIEN
jgi:hypothetical protein